MTFKKDWEKTDQHFQIGIPILEAMLDHALPNQKVSSHTVISGGCANLNIKVNFEKRSEPLILRIYLRDKDAAYREQNLATLINHSIPIPEVYFVGDIDNYRFSNIYHFEKLPKNPSHTFTKHKKMETLQVRDKQHTKERNREVKT